jgi:thiol-disulfide isomerase/thioredoxin
MQQIFNQYSYLLISLFVIVVTMLVLWRSGVRRRVFAGTVAAFVVFAVSGYLLLRPGISDVDSVAQAQATINNGKPTFLEFFSNYCAGCLALRPSVDLLAAEIDAEFNILRVDIHTDFGRELRQNFRFTYTPEFVLLDRNGEEVWRAHTIPPRDQVLALAPNLHGLAAN